MHSQYQWVFYLYTIYIDNFLHSSCLDIVLRGAPRILYFLLLDFLFYLVLLLPVLAAAPDNYLLSLYYFLIYLTVCNLYDILINIPASYYFPIFHQLYISVQQLTINYSIYKASPVVYIPLSLSLIKFGFSYYLLILLQSFITNLHAFYLFIFPFSPLTHLSSLQLQTCNILNFL